MPSRLWAPDEKQALGVRSAPVCESSERDRASKPRDRDRRPQGEDAGGGFGRNPTRARPKGVAMIQGKTKTSGRIGAIDELRGLAIVLVMLSHVGLVYGLETDVAYALALPAFGVGVDLFFVISGFVIYRNVSAMKDLAGGNALAGAWAFWARRLVRIAAAGLGDRRRYRRGSHSAGRLRRVMGRSRRGCRVLRKCLLGGLRGELCPLPSSSRRLAFLELIARRAILCAGPGSRGPAPACGDTGGCDCPGRGGGSSPACRVIPMDNATRRPVDRDGRRGAARASRHAAKFLARSEPRTSGLLGVRRLHSRATGDRALFGSGPRCRGLVVWVRRRGAPESWRSRVLAREGVA